MFFLFARNKVIIASTMARCFGVFITTHFQTFDIPTFNRIEASSHHKSNQKYSNKQIKKTYPCPSDCQRTTIVFILVPFSSRTFRSKNHILILETKQKIKKKRAKVSSRFTKKQVQALRVFEKISTLTVSQ